MISFMTSPSDVTFPCDKILLSNSFYTTPRTFRMGIDRGVDARLSRASFIESVAQLRIRVQERFSMYPEFRGPS